MAESKRDKNYVPALIAADITDLENTIQLAADPANNRLLVSTIVTGDTAGLATSANQTNGTQKSKIVGAGSDVDIKDDTFYGDGVTTGILSTAVRLWNGASYDRLPGDTTGVKVKVQDQLPTVGNNGALVLGYTGANLTTITKTINAVQYRKTLGYTGSDLTSVSAWVQI
jgi:hypothetical protein